MIKTPTARFLASVLIPVLCATAAPVAIAQPAPTAPSVVVYPVPPGYPTASGISLKAGGKSVPVLKFRNAGKGEEFRYASFSFAGTVPLEIRPGGDISTSVLRPAGYKIPVTQSDGAFRFTLSQPRNLVFQTPGQPPLFIFANPLETAVPKASGPGVVNLRTDRAADATGAQDVTDKLQKAIDDISAAGGGVVYVPNGTYQTKAFWLKPGVNLYLEGGAAIRFTGNSADLEKEFTKSDPRYPKPGCPGGYFIRATDGKNIRVSGRGIIDCNGDALYEKEKCLISAMRPVHVNGFAVEGVIITDSTSWTVVPGFCKSVLFQNTKILNSGRRPQNDGFDPISCQDVLVDHCFVHTNDDAYCPKPGGAGTHGGGVKPGPALEMTNVVFNDCVAWTSCAAFKLGLQSSENAAGITFKNSYALECRRACVIERNGGEASTKNVTFQNIGVECEPRTGTLWVAITPKGKGPVDNVLFDRVQVQGGAGVRLLGLDDACAITNVTFKDCTWGGAPITDARSGHISAKFVKNLQFLPGK